MKAFAATRLLMIGGLLAVASPTLAQDDADAGDAQEAVSSTNPRADVWAAVEGQWNAATKNTDRWIDDYLADEFVGWGKDSPAPRSKSSTRLWDRFERSQGRVVAHELYPLSIVVHGNTAIAHYLYTSAFEDKDGKVDVSNGRYTDILVFDDGDWKFIAWHGGDD